MVLPQSARSGSDLLSYRTSRMTAGLSIAGISNHLEGFKRVADLQFSFFSIPLERTFLRFLDAQLYFSFLPAVAFASADNSPSNSS
jgi:hypothetical protein